jgi:hypothetical protein
MRAAPGPAIPGARPIARSRRRVDMAQLPSSSGTHASPDLANYRAPSAAFTGMTAL